MLNKLIALQKIVELGSFTKAAASLGYTQPAISQMVHALEADFSIQLLYRSRSGIHLTPEGEKIFPFIETTLLHYQMLQEAVAETKGLEDGVIRIGTVSSISSQWLPKLIKDFQQEYPKVKFVLHQGDYTTIPEWIEKGAVDFGFVNPDAVPHLHTTFIKEDVLKAIVPIDYPLNDGDSISLQELAKEPFLLLEEGILSEPLEVFKSLNLTPDIRLRVHDDYSILSMIESGLGVSILPELILKRVNYKVTVLATSPVIKRKIGILVKDKKTQSLASKYFIEFLLSKISSLP